MPTYLRDPAFARRVQWLLMAAGGGTRQRAADRVAVVDAGPEGASAAAWRERLRRWESTGSLPPIEQLEKVVTALLGAKEPSSAARWLLGGCGALPEAFVECARRIPPPGPDGTTVRGVERRKTWKAIMKQAQFAIASGPSAHEIARARVLELLKEG